MSRQRWMTRGSWRALRLQSLTDAGSREAAPAEEPAEMAVVTPSSEERVVVAPDTKAILCGTCGQPNSLDTKFCQTCGQYLEWGGATIGTSPDDSPVAVESPEPEATIHRPAPKMQLPRSRPRQVSDGSFPAESGPPSPRCVAIGVGTAILGAAALVILVAVVATRGS